MNHPNHSWNRYSHLFGNNTFFTTRNTTKIDKRPSTSGSVSLRKSRDLSKKDYRELIEKKLENVKKHIEKHSKESNAEILLEPLKSPKKQLEVWWANNDYEFTGNRKL